MLWGAGIAVDRPARAKNREVMVTFIVSLEVDRSRRWYCGIATLKSDN